MNSLFARLRAAITGDFSNIAVASDPDTGRTFTAEDFRKAGVRLTAENERLKRELAQVRDKNDQLNHQNRLLQHSVETLREQKPAKTQRGQHHEDDAPMPDPFGATRQRFEEIMDEAGVDEAERTWDHYLTLGQAKEKVLEMVGLPADWQPGDPQPERRGRRRINVKPLIARMTPSDAQKLSLWIGQHRPELEGYGPTQDGPGRGGPGGPGGNPPPPARQRIARGYSAENEDDQEDRKKLRVTAAPRRVTFDPQRVGLGPSRPRR